MPTAPRAVDPHFPPEAAVQVLQHAEERRRAGDLRTALAANQLALHYHPHLFPDAYLNLGITFRDLKRDEEAVAAYRDGLALCPWHQGLLRNLCSALSTHQPEIAARVGERALVLDPGSANSMANYQACLQSIPERREDARRWAARYIATAPRHPSAWSAMAFSQYHAGRPHAALPFARMAVALAPSSAGALGQLGVLYQELRMTEESLLTTQRAIRAEPGVAGPKWNEALALLDQGRLKEGWDAYEHRFAAGATARRRHYLDVPQWDGRPLAQTERLLVWREQGVGDEIMFASMYPELPRGTIVECSTRLVSLFKRSFPHLDIRAELDGPLPPVTHQIACGSLPRLKRWGLPCFPTGQGKAYLRANPALDRSCPQSFGISWRSMRSRTGGVAKGYPLLDEWRPLLGTCFASLQYDNEAPLDPVPFEVDIPDLDLRNDFEGIAALICSLDAVVSVGNTVASLSIALGVPTAMLLLEGDYTMLGTGTYPWWPNVTTFVRRHDETDWSRQIEGVRQWLMTRSP